MTTLTDTQIADINDQKYHQTVSNALDAARVRIRQEHSGYFLPYNMSNGRVVIFSDQHRGAGNRADDFRRSQQAYNAALAYYFHLKYILVELGDVEELWEERPKAVLRDHKYSISLSAQFHHEGRYFKIWGNHDDAWRNDSMVAKHLRPLYGTDINGSPLQVHEGLEIAVVNNGTELGRILLVHGHQGTQLSDRFGQISRFFVRWVWRPVQRFTNISLNTPAKNWLLREKHNIALYKWAQQQQKLILIAGHTHRPVMRSKKLADQLEERIRIVDGEIASGAGNQNLLAELQAELAWVRSQDFGQHGPEGAPQGTIPMTRSCYFNTGCCCYGDGDITGFELIGDQIRLVRWPDDNDKPRPIILASCSFAEAFDL